jgi:hypothetical protein
MVCNLKESMQTMTASGLFKVKRLIRRMKDSIPGVQTTFHQSHNIRHFDVFAVGSIHLKKPPGGPKGLIGPPCHGAPWPPEAKIGIDIM